MRSTAVTLAIMLAPATLFAQGSVTTTTDTHASARADVPHAHAAADARATTSTNAEVQAPSSFSARDRANLEATFSRARAEHVPEQPLRDRVAEGEARGASNEQILVATGMLESRMASSQRAMIQAGHAHPSDAEVERGADAEAAGYTSEEIEGIARRTPPERSVAVALGVLTKLAARGVPTTRALAQVESRLDAHASDESLASLAASGDADAAGAAKAAHGAATGVNAAGNAAAGVTATAHGVGSTTATVSGAVTGVLGHSP